MRKLNHVLRQSERVGEIDLFALYRAGTAGLANKRTCMLGCLWSPHLPKLHVAELHKTHVVKWIQPPLRRCHRRRSPEAVLRGQVDL